MYCDFPEGEVAMKRFVISAVFIFTCCLPLVQCVKTESAYRFMVVAYKGICSGYYIQDSKDLKGFDVTDSSSGSNYNTFTQDLDSPSTIKVQVNAEGTADVPSSVTVYIYADDKIVKEATFNRETTSTYNNNTKEYDYSYSVDGSLTYDFEAGTGTSATN
jgi:hypothetical protein